MNNIDIMLIIGALWTFLGFILQINTGFYIKKRYPNLYKELTDINLFLTMPMKRRFRIISGKESNDAKLRLRFILTIIFAIIWVAIWLIFIQVFTSVATRE